MKIRRATVSKENKKEGKHYTEKDVFMDKLDKEIIADNPSLMDEVTINRYEICNIFARVTARIKSPELTDAALLIMPDFIDAIFDEDGEDEED